jgi:hypothetical protein
MRAGLALALILLPAMAWAASPFKGSWSGRWRSPDFHQSGSVAFTVDAGGHLEGPIGNDTIGLQGTIQGMVQPDGTADLTYSYDGGLSLSHARGRVTREDDRLVARVRFTGPNGEAFGEGIVEVSDTGTMHL